MNALLDAELQKRGLAAPKKNGLALIDKELARRGANDEEIGPPQVGQEKVTVDRPGFVEKLATKALGGAADLFTGDSRKGEFVNVEGKQVPVPKDLGGFGDIGTDTLSQTFQKGAIALTTQNPYQRAEVLTKIIPGTAARPDDKGNIILFRGETPLGYVDKPGFDRQDVMDVIHSALPFIPGEALAVKLTAAIPGAFVRGTTRLAMEGAGAGATQTGLNVAAANQGATADNSEDITGAMIGAPVGRMAGDVLGRLVNMGGTALGGSLRTLSRFNDDGSLTPEQLAVLQRADVSPNDASPEMVRAVLLAAKRQGVTGKAAAARPSAAGSIVFDEEPGAAIDTRLNIAQTEAARQQFPRLNYTTAERTGNARALERQETILNSSDPGAGELRDFKQLQANNVAQTMTDIQRKIADGVETVRNTRDLSNNVFGQLKKSAEEEKVIVRELYDAIPPDVRMQSLGRLRELVDQNVNRETLTKNRPLAQGMLQQIDELEGGDIGLAKFDALRQDINAILRDPSVRGNEKSILGKIKDSFDDYEKEIVSARMLDGGEVKDAISTVRNARAASLKFARRWLPKKAGSRGTSYADEGGAMMAQIADDFNMDADKFYTKVFGDGAFGGKPMAKQVAERIKRNFTEDSEVFKNYQQLAVLQLFKGAVEDGIANPAKVIRAVKRAANPENGKANALFKEVFNPAQRKELQDFAAALRPMIASKELGNPSKTAYRLRRYFIDGMNKFYGTMIASGDVTASIPWVVDIAGQGIKGRSARDAARLTRKDPVAPSLQYTGPRSAFPIIGGALGAGYGPQGLAEVSPLLQQILSDREQQRQGQ